MRENELAAINEAKKRTKISFIVTIAIGLVAFAFGVASSGFPRGVRDAIGYSSVGVFAVSVLSFLVSLHFSKKYRYLRNQHYARRDGVHPLDNNERIKLNLLASCTKRQKSGNESIDHIISYATTMDPLSVVYLNYRMKLPDLDKIYTFLKKNNDKLQNEFNEYIPYSCFLFVLTFNVVSLWAKGCLDVGDDELLDCIRSYCVTNEATGIRRLIIRGEEIFKEKYEVK